VSAVTLADATGYGLTQRPAPFGGAGFLDTALARAYTLAPGREPAEQPQDR
jgi:hypothetical protein